MMCPNDALWTNMSCELHIYVLPHLYRGIISFATHYLYINYRLIFNYIQHIPKRLNKCHVVMFYKKVNVNCEFGIYVTSPLYLDILFTRIIHWHTTGLYGILHIMFQLIDGGMFTYTYTRVSRRL